MPDPPAFGERDFRHCLIISLAEKRRICVNELDLAAEPARGKQSVHKRCIIAVCPQAAALRLAAVCAETLNHTKRFGAALFIFYAALLINSGN